MASVLSIESINLNGDLLTAQDGSLYINNNLIKNSSGVQLSDRFFIKGYAPISFYTKWPQQGDYLNETYLNDFFMATGLLVTCSHPSTGLQSLLGAIYERPASSSINTNPFAGFELQPKQIIQHSSLNYKVERNQILGLNIYNAPSDMRSISIHLLGYFPAAAHFDRMPKQVDFYSNTIDVVSNGIHEEYSQWDSLYSGVGIYCGHTGEDALTFVENITGYISGVVDKNPLLIQSLSLIKTSCDPCQPPEDISQWSGYYLDDNRVYFPLQSQFSGFSGQEGFNEVSGFNYSGFQISPNSIISNGIYSGYGGKRFGSGETFQNIGWRSGVLQEIISGFVSGYLDQYGGFYRLPLITTGTSGSGMMINNRYEPFINLDTGNLPLDLSGRIIGSSGYFIGDKKYFFPSDRPIKYDIVGFLSGFMSPSDIFSTGNSSGYFIDTPSDYIQVFFRTGNLFENFINTYGLYTGSGYSSQYTGFSFPLGSGFSGLNGSPNNVSGIMTGIIGAAHVFIPFSGFSGRNNIDIGLGYSYSGPDYYTNEYFFSGWRFDGSGYTGQLINSIGTRNYSGYQEITGFVRTTAKEQFQILSEDLPPGTSGISGYFVDNNAYAFESGQFDPIYNKFPKFDNNPSFKYGYSYSGFYANTSGFSGVGQFEIQKEYVVGFLSGYKDSLNNFYTFADPTGSSGVFIDGERILFPSGLLFSGFSGLSGFDSGLGFVYSGLGAPPYHGNNFTGDFFVGSGSGVVTGIVGWRNANVITKEYGTGIITGIIGSRNTPYPGNLTGNFYSKDKYGNKTMGPGFYLSIGQFYYESPSFSFKVSAGSRVGIDIYNPLSGISDINVAMFGYYE